MDSMSFPCLQHTKERSGKVTLPFLDDHSCCCQTAISLWLNGLHLICVAQKRWDSCKALERLVLMGDWAEGRSPSLIGRRRLCSLSACSLWIKQRSRLPDWVGLLWQPNMFVVMGLCFCSCFRGVRQYILMVRWTRIPVWLGSNDHFYCWNNFITLEIPLVRSGLCLS